MEIFFQLFLAALLGGLIGLERECKNKQAGLRTYALVCLGSALFTIIAFEVSQAFLEKPGAGVDPTRVIQAVATGIGFIGAGLIVFRRNTIEGLTTAAGLWVVAAVGVAIGAKLYLPALFTAFLAILILVSLQIKKKGEKQNLNPFKKKKK